MPHCGGGLRVNDRRVQMRPKRPSGPSPLQAQPLLCQSHHIGLVGSRASLGSRPRKSRFLSLASVSPLQLPEHGPRCKSHPPPTRYPVAAQEDTEHFANEQPLCLSHQLWLGPQECQLQGGVPKPGTLAATGFSQPSRAQCRQAGPPSCPLSTTPLGAAAQLADRCPRWASEARGQGAHTSAAGPALLRSCSLLLRTPRRFQKSRATSRDRLSCSLRIFQAQPPAPSPLKEPPEAFEELQQTGVNIWLPGGVRLGWGVLLRPRTSPPPHGPRAPGRRVHPAGLGSPTAVASEGKARPRPRSLPLAAALGPDVPACGRGRSNSGWQRS